MLICPEKINTFVTCNYSFSLLQRYPVLFFEKIPHFKAHDNQPAPGCAGSVALLLVLFSWKFYETTSNKGLVKLLFPGGGELQVNAASLNENISLYSKSG